MAKLNQLEIKILLKLNEKTSLSKTMFNKCFWHINKTERKQAIHKLISNHFIVSNPIPKPKVKKTPLYYFLTKNGECWVDNYIKNLPV